MRRIRRQPGCQPRRVVGREQLRWIAQAALGVGDASVALAPRDLDRLDLRVKALGRQRLTHRPVERRQHVERDQRGDSLRIRRHGGDLDVAVASGDRLHPVAVVRGDVIGGHHAARRLDGAGDLVADRAAVVGVSAAIRERAERPSEQRLTEPIASVAGLTEHGASVSVEPVQRGRYRSGVDRGQLVAVVRDRGGRKHGIGKRATAEALEQLRPRVDGAGDRDRQWPASRHGVVTGGAHRLDGQRSRGAAAAVEPMQMPVGGIPDQRERVAAQSAGVAVDDGEHRVGGDRRIDGGAAGSQCIDTGLRRQRMRGDDHAVRCGGGGHRLDGSRMKRAP